jgi:DNA polymerase
MNILTVDIETFYSQTYSLSKITTEEYVRSPDFQTIGVCVKKDDGYTVWFSGTKAETKRFLDHYDWANSTVVAHNAVFDMSILNWHYDIRPKRIVDTLSMARALGHGSVSLANLVKEYGLGEKGHEVVNALGKRLEDFSPVELERYAAYCRNDVELTYALFDAMAHDFPVNELRLIDLTVRMFTEPVLELDKLELESHLCGVIAAKDALMRAVVADREQLMSNPKLAQLLKVYGIDPPKKISPTTGKETWAFGKTDEEFKALLEHESIAVQAIVAARLGIKSTLEETRTERLLGVEQRGLLPIPLRYYAAHTGRWGGDDKINMQNLPRTSQLKHAIKAPKGYVVLDSDSSQIEARMLAWLAQQDDLVDAFECGEDVYCIMASAIYGRPITKADVLERFVGKMVILGCGYGTGWLKLQSALKAATPSITLTEDEAKAIIATYRQTYAYIPALWRQADEAIKAMIGDMSTPIGREGVLFVEGKKGIRLPNGLYLRYPNLRCRENPETMKLEYIYNTKKGKSLVPTKLYGAKLIENICQALARIVIGEQILLVAKKYRPVMTVHDAIGTVVPEHNADQAQEFVEMCMRMRPKWALGLPLNCEAGYGPTYGDCK